MTISIKSKYLLFNIKCFLKFSGDIKNSLILFIFPVLVEISFFIFLSTPIKSSIFYYFHSILKLKHLITSLI